MKKTILLITAILLIAELAQASTTQTQQVTATVVKVNMDAAYLYRTSQKIDNNVVNFLEDLGFNVTKISEKQIPTTNLSFYKLIIVGDENFKKPVDLKVWNYPVVIINHYNLYQFGLTDRDGGSILGATSPLSVIINNSSVQVYTQASRTDRVSANYIYLDKNNIAPNLQSIAFTQPTSSGRKFGTVIAHATPGTILANGKVVQRNLCFFGIRESKFWTQNAKSLFKDCVDFVSN